MCLERGGAVKVELFSVSSVHHIDQKCPVLAFTMHSSFLGVDSFSLLFNGFSEGIKAQFS